MPDYYRDGVSDAIALVMFIMGVVLVALCIGVSVKDNEKQQLQKDKAPCSTFKQDKLEDVPARCITPQGGFSG